MTEPRSPVTRLTIDGLHVPSPERSTPALESAAIALMDENDQLAAERDAAVARAERAEAQVRAAEALPSRLADISRWITASYAPGMDPELVMRRRVGKIGNEYGELLDAIEGYTGENPRKGVYKTRDDVIDELLDCASSSLAAVEHMTGDRGDSLNRLAVRTEMQGERLRAALAQEATP